MCAILSSPSSSANPIGEWQRVIVGAYVIHGSNEAPDWSSHTCGLSDDNQRPCLQSALNLNGLFF